jgi:hypothetical protein
MRKDRHVLSKEIAKKKIDGKYIFDCLGCGEEMSVKPHYVVKHSGKCKSCSQKKDAYLSIFNAFKLGSASRGLKVDIDFQDFLNFTKIPDCHYCGDLLEWKPHKDPGTTSFRYFLDRKDSNIGYELDNLVTCCTLCNLTKSDKFTYEEFIKIGQVIRNIKEDRKC